MTENLCGTETCCMEKIVRVMMEFFLSVIGHNLFSFDRKKNPQFKFKKIFTLKWKTVSLVTIETQIFIVAKCTQHNTLKEIIHIFLLIHNFISLHVFHLKFHKLTILINLKLTVSDVTLSNHEPVRVRIRSQYSKLSNPSWVDST